MQIVIIVLCCFRLQRYKLLKAIHNRTSHVLIVLYVVSDYKDTNFWKQFTTTIIILSQKRMLFQTTKIQTFESNSQLYPRADNHLLCCFRLQRYKLLKAIHNHPQVGRCSFALFQTTKIQTFESNSQPYRPLGIIMISCFRLQRYKLLKAIHNRDHKLCYNRAVVSDYKDTNFWKQFTTAIG